jgi:hypothetical protein
MERIYKTLNEKTDVPMSNEELSESEHPIMY